MTLRETVFPTSHPGRPATRLRLKPAIVSLGILLAFLNCQQSSAQAAAAAREAQASAAKTKPSPVPKQPNDKKWGKLEGNAVWYSVPPNSLAKRRAGIAELTAAHNRLPLGTMVRVTHLTNGKSVIVRITDRGITKRGALIDLCKEAAAKLGMLSEGSARVRLEILPDDKGANTLPRAKTPLANP